MEYQIHGKSYTLHTNIKENNARRLSFDALAQQTFGISFESWHRAGYWTDAYQPYTLFDGAQAVANVSVNHMHTTWRGDVRRYIQLGTVMTHPEHGGRGLADALMRRVLHDWKRHCDAIYLYANDAVLGFYPPYGFVAATEYWANLQIAPKKSSIKQLEMTRTDHLALLCRCYQEGNPHANLPLLDNFGLLMFYCSSFLQDCVYYVQDADAIVIAEQQEYGLLVYDIYGGDGASFQEVLGTLAYATGAAHVQLGFAWADAPASSLSPLRQEDTTLFVMTGMENLFAKNHTMFPLLSHA